MTGERCLPKESKMSLHADVVNNVGVLLDCLHFCMMFCMPVLVWFVCCFGDSLLVVVSFITSVPVWTCFDRDIMTKAV